MQDTLIKDSVEVASKFYLIEKCFDCEYSYAAEIKEGHEDTIIKNYQNKKLRNQNGDLMRGIDCPRCKSSNTRYIDLQARFI
jgi:phage FluMu protein Com